ncbi:hypothetical protein DAI22_08g151800 [Oryza sativa Japonica Group]|nr:hypothetical protein DAI22_08g151800 [Oryza sativa Japonica Group]
MASSQARLVKTGSTTTTYPTHPSCQNPSGSIVLNPTRGSMNPCSTYRKTFCFA